MRLRRYLRLAFAILFVCAAYSALAQVVPAATQSRSTFAAGVGLSDYNLDWEQGRLLGGTLWLGYTPARMPWFLHGVGLDIEARDLNYGRSSASPDLREDTAMGGPIYSWHHYRKFQPYAKFLFGYGNRDAEYVNTKIVPNIFERYNDNRNILAWGGGVDYQVSRSIWVRGDYEYQRWPDMVFKNAIPVGIPIAPIHPNGFTIGALYHFGSPHLH
jgi:opacity protein-like surface antigen